MPRISCIIPTYNYARYVTQAVDSVLPVLRQGDRLIVIDDGSTDDTRQRLQPYIDGGAIHYHYQANAGEGAARNAGARMADGDYLYFLDADDRAIKDGFEKLRHIVERNPRVAIAVGGYLSVTAAKRRRGKKIPVGDDRQKNFFNYLIRRRSPVGTGKVLLRRDVALRHPFQEGMQNNADIPVYAWILANEDVLATPEPVVEIVKHENSARSRSAGYAAVIERLPEIVFDPRKLPLPFMKWKKRYACNLLLELFREQYLARDYAAARRSYQQSLRCRPLNVLQWSYLRKYLRMRVA